MKVMISIIISLLLYSCLYSMDSISMDGGGSSKRNQKITSSNLNKVLTRVHQLQKVFREEHGLSKLVDSLSESEKPDEKGKQKEFEVKSNYNKNVKKEYSTTEVMNLISKFNPLLSEFGNEHTIPIEELAIYANLLQEFKIDATAMASFAKQNHNIPIHPKGHEIRAYQNIETQDPNKYTLLVLEIFKEMIDQANGVKKPTQLSNTHFDILHTQIEDQQDTIFKGKIGIVLHSLFTIGSIAWAVYGQIINTTNGHGGNVTGT